MPEGPSIVIAADALQSLVGKKILKVGGNSKIDHSLLSNQHVREIKSWGKHLLICLDHVTIRIHFLMFGSFLLNEKKPRPERLSLSFKKDELNVYTASIKLIEGPLEETYDFRADVLSNSWSPRLASGKLNKTPDLLSCDALLDQDIFAGVGNIIKNEVLFRVRVHPASKIGKLPAKVKSALIKEARNYSFEFLKWKRNFELKKHWLVYTKKVCPRDHGPIKKEYLGKTKRRTFYCEICQKLYR